MLNITVTLTHLAVSKCTGEEKEFGGDAPKKIFAKSRPLHWL